MNLKIVDWRTFLITETVLGLAFFSIYTGRDIGGNTLTVLITVVPLYYTQSGVKKWIDKTKGSA